MSNHPERDEGRGCLTLLSIAALSVGVGGLWGYAYGLLVAGFLLLGLVILSGLLDD